MPSGGLFNAVQGATTSVAAQQQPFWGAPYGQVPSPLGLLDSNGDNDPNWSIDPSSFNPWDTATLLGMRVPGIVRFEARKAQRHQKRSSPGDDFANITQMGWDLAEATMTVRLWTEKQFYDWQAIIQKLEQQLLSAKTAALGGGSEYAGGFAAVTVEYPGLAMHSISKLWVKELTPLAPTNDAGVFQAKVQFTEFNPARQGSTKTVIGAPPGLSSINQTYGNQPAQKNATTSPPSQGGGITSPLSALME